MRESTVRCGDEGFAHKVRYSNRGAEVIESAISDANIDLTAFANFPEDSGCEMENLPKLQVYSFSPRQRGEDWSLSVDLQELNMIRQPLLAHGLIGKFTEGQWAGYDYGNFSLLDDGKIIVSCSQTSSLPAVSKDDLAVVAGYDAESFTVEYFGKKVPSSESSLHFSAYQARPDLGAVVHGHMMDFDPAHKTIAEYFLANDLPLTTSLGKSREIGQELKNLINQRQQTGIIGMLNHDGGFGLLSLGSSFSEASQQLVDFQGRLNSWLEGLKSRN
ncbi:MAG TPA: class II aldolase/adducin family protein [Rhodanobacter sp.]|nr:class II aldolase/adducin family protein [Rhodanobacter sp.]